MKFLSILILVFTGQVAYCQLTIFNDANQAGLSSSCMQRTIYAGNSIPQGLNNQVSSIQLQQGYMATLAENDDGTGSAYTFVAAISNVTVNLSNLLNDKVSFIRVLPLSNTKKKGIGNTNNAWIDLLNVSWFYDWGPLDVGLASREYALMAWGKNAANNSTSINNYIAKADITHLLSFNEPDNVDQSNIAFGEAVTLHKNLAATGYRLGSPAPTEGQATVWLTNFMDSAARANVKVDFMAVHWYDWGSYLNTLNTSPDPNGVFTRFKNYINNIYAIYHKPIWITEFNANRNTTSATHEAFIALALPWLESQNFVERYAYFFPPALPPVDAGGNLTAIGNAYKNQVSNQLSLSKNWDNTENFAADNTGVFEAENATLIGSSVTSCANASNGQMAAAVTGSSNKIVFHSVAVNTAGSYNLGIHYYASAPKTTTVKVNGLSRSISLPASGAWCYQGGRPGTFQSTIQLNAGSNTIEFTESPIIDKINIGLLAALPVKILDFYALPKPGGIELHWRTAQEINNNYFEIFQSGDAVNFKSFARVNGKGNSPVLNSYNIVDGSPLTGTNYYQLRQVDLDGKTTVFRTIAVKYGVPADKIRVLSSNPNELVISITLSDKEKGSIIFTDMVGRLIYNQETSLVNGENILRLNLPNLSHVGVLSFVTNKQRLNVKLLR